MILNSEPRVKASERGEHLISVLGECTRCLPGCRICCEQQPPKIASAEQLVKQEWDFPQETDESSSGEKTYFIIGEGGFSLVFLETLRLHPAKPVLCAVKRLENAVSSKVPLTESRKSREVEILKELQKKDDWHWSHRTGDHNDGYRYIVSYLGTYLRAQRVHIVMEYMAQSDLKHYMDMPWQEHNTRIVVKQLLSGLQFVHGCGFAHRDLKPLNIFPILSHDYSLLIKIGDFGAAKFASAEDPLATGIGTWEHQAPEVFGDGPYTLAVDIWSLGTIFFTLLTGRPLFPNRNAFNTHIFKFEGCGEHSPRNALLAQGVKSEAAIDLVAWMLQIRPEDRPSAEGALSHRWFSNPSGMETQVTPELYSHFVKVLSGPVLQRFMKVQPVENGPSIVSSTVDETRPSTGQSPTVSRSDSFKRAFRKRFSFNFSVKKH